MCIFDQLYFGLNGKPEIQILNTLFNIPIAIETAQLKVRQIRNDFFKPMVLPKNERTNSTLLLVDLFHSFLEESEDTKKTF